MLLQPVVVDEADLVVEAEAEEEVEDADVADLVVVAGVERKVKRSGFQ